MYRSDRIIEVPAVGDAVSLGLRVENSYDGSAKFRLVLMAYVLSCTNGMMVPRFFTTYTMRHSVENRLDLRGAVDLLNNGVTLLENLAPRIASSGWDPAQREAARRGGEEHRPAEPRLGSDPAEPGQREDALGPDAGGYAPADLQRQGPRPHHDLRAGR